MTVGEDTLGRDPTDMWTGGGGGVLADSIGERSGGEVDK